MPPASSRAWAGHGRGPPSLAWRATEAPPDRRGELLGTALGAAVGGALFGPVVGAIADGVGTGPAFATAAVAGAALMVATFLMPRPHASTPQGLPEMWRPWVTSEGRACGLRCSAGWPSARARAHAAASR